MAAVRPSEAPGVPADAAACPRDERLLHCAAARAVRRKVVGSGRGVAWQDWIRTVEIEPSLYAADFANLAEQIDVLLRTGARVFHFDVGDGHFVEPITFGPIVLQAIAPRVHAMGGVLDCHLMVDNPTRHFPQIARTRELLPETIQVQVDGGVDNDNVRSVYDAGATLIVAGSSIFHREDLQR